MAQSVTNPPKTPPVVQETPVQSLDQEDPLEKEMATHSTVLAWEIPLIEKPAMVHWIARVGHDLVKALYKYSNS